MTDEQIPLSTEEVRILDALGESIAAKRQDAIAARKESGIEDVWMKCEEAFVGVDALNRGEFKKAKWAKPTSMEGPVSEDTADTDNTKSTIYVPITRRYVSAGAAKLSEILLPTDDKPFSIDPTPFPEFVQAKEIVSKAFKDLMANGGDAPQVQQPAPQLPGGVPSQQAPMAQAIGQAMPSPVDRAKQLINDAITRAKKAETRIQDWLVECNHRGHMRKVIFDGARIGVGVLKGPFAEERKAMAVANKNGILDIQISTKIAPATKWVDPWNCFPDGSCGEDIQDGDYFFERDYLSPKALKKLKRQAGYLPEMIDKVLLEGPEKCNVEDGENPNRGDKNKTKDTRFTVWYYYGTVGRQEMATAKARGIEVRNDTEDGCHAIVTMVNDTVIRAVLNPLDSGDFPYRTFPWCRRPGHWAGQGVGEQVDVPQRIINGASRALMNNTGLASGSQIVLDQLAIVPADTSWTIVPNKLWFKAPGADFDDIRKVFMSVEFQSQKEALMAVIEYGFRLAEESTNIPLITQGMSGTTTPDTYGAAQLQNNNANQLLRDIGYIVDEHVTEPTINAYYEWLLLDPDVPADEKGDWQINAHGSSALVERAIQDQTIQGMAGMVLNPAFGVDPKKWFSEYMKTKRLDPRTVQYDEGVQPPQAPPPYQLQVAEINAKSRKEVAVLAAQADIEDTKSDAQLRREDLAQRRELALLQYANTRQISLEDAKRSLAETGMKIRTQKELAAMNGRGPQVMAPPTEPPGRARPGYAFQQ